MRVSIVYLAEFFLWTAAFSALALGAVLFRGFLSLVFSVGLGGDVLSARVVGGEVAFFGLFAFAAAA